MKSTNTSYVQDNMNRQLNCFIARPTDTPLLLAEELVQHGFIHTMDSSLIQVWCFGVIFLMSNVFP